MRGHGSVPAEDSSSASGVTASGASRRLRPRQRADDASLTKPCEATEPAGRSSSEGSGLRDAPLTPAEKQKAYRKRLKADPVRYKEYLKRERARKR